MQGLFKDLDIISPFIVLLYVIIFRKIKGDSRIIFYYLLMQFVLNLGASILYLRFVINNIWVYQLNCFLSFFLLVIFFRKINPFWKKFDKKNILSGLFMLLLAIIIFSENRNAFNSISYTIVSIAITFLCLNYYWFLVKETPLVSIYKNEFFFFVTGLLIYYSSNILVFASYRILTLDHLQTMSFWLLWKFHNFMLAVMCIFILKGFTCVTLPKTRS